MSRPRLDFVAVAGLEPAPHSRTLSCRCSTTLNYTANRLFLYIALYLRPSRARKPLLAFALQHYPSPQHGLTHYWCLLSGLRLIVLLNTPLLPWLIRPTLNIPTLPSALHYYLPALLSTCRDHLVAVAGVGTYRYSLSAVLTDWLPSLSTPSAFVVSFDAVSCKSLQMLSF